MVMLMVMLINLQTNHDYRTQCALFADSCLVDIALLYTIAAAPMCERTAIYGQVHTIEGLMQGAEACSYAATRGCLWHVMCA